MQYKLILLLKQPQSPDFNPIYVGIGLVLLSGVIIFGGLKSIAKVAELVVPVMALAYLLLAFGLLGTILNDYLKFLC